VAQRFEEHLKKRLRCESGSGGVDRYMSAYRITRDKLIDNLFKEIKGVEPDLSDHSDTHVKDVLFNSRRLLSESHGQHGLSAIELYCLAMFILFHDVGNLFGRKDHHKNVGIVYDWARGSDPNLRHERTLVIRAAVSHTGDASDGTKDTRKEIDETDHLDGERVRLRELVAILRFADELAEGPQRTSEFMRSEGFYDEKSQLYHDYASVTHIHIDRPDERIRVTYEISLDPRDGESNDQRDQRISALLKFTYRRIVKLDQERRYAKFYSDVLTPFRLVSVQMNFHHEDRLLPHSLPAIQLDDKVVPGDPSRLIEDLDERYTIDELLKELKRLM